jgi:N-acetylmuramoyl-L-alanine amidase
MRRQGFAALFALLIAGCVYNPPAAPEPPPKLEPRTYPSPKEPSGKGTTAPELPRKPADKPPSIPERPAMAQPLTIAIDAGHGGFWTGGIGRSGLMEKDINLDVALELERIFISWGATVVMTRRSDLYFSTDRDRDLSERCAIVNRAKPDLFLSIHTNYVDGSGPRGYEVWVAKNATGARDRDSRELASFIREELGRVWGPEDRGTKDEKNLHVLNGTHCPAVLAEMEFVSNPAVERQLAKHSVRVQIAEAVARAARRWLAGHGHRDLGKP